MSAEHKALNGAEMLIKTLEALGVEHIFGYSGGAVIPIFDAIVTTGTTIKVVTVRHEQGAVHMADGYARASGKPGVVLVTSGPGAGNTISGIMTAQMDSVPLLVISGQQIQSMLGLDAFQETDVINLSLPLVKHSYQIFDAGGIEQTVREAYAMAAEGRPGPVVIDIPKDVSSAACTPGTSQSELPIPHAGMRPAATTAGVTQAGLAAIANAISASQRPLLLIGNGVIISDATEGLRSFMEQFQIPAVTTLLGKGAVDETSSLSLGMLGMHGTAYANLAMQETDCLVNIGSRFDDRIIGDAETFASGAVVCHIDIDETEIGKMIRPDFAAVCDAGEAISALQQLVCPTSRPGWLARIEQLRTDYPLSYERPDQVLSQQHILSSLDSLTGGEAIVTTDVGQHQMWAAQFCRATKPRHWLTSGGAGTMGFGMPAAIGAQFACPEALVISISGDGGFQMTEYELATAAIHKLPIKIIILDNKYLGMVRQWQEIFYDNRESGVSLQGNPNFAMLAAAYGIKAVHITDPLSAAGQLQDALDYRDGPVVVWCEVAKTDNVYPMIPAGRPYSHMLLGPPTEKLDKPVGST